MPISNTVISIISLTPNPSVLPVKDQGHCDPIGVAQCGTCTWVNAATNVPIPGAVTFDCCTVGTGPACASAAVPKDVPIKQLINGSSIAPWVRISFENQSSPDDSTVITTGNISQGLKCNTFAPGTDNSACCRASIKSFQFGWGAIGSGNTCKVTIVDEQGSSFRSWVDRVVQKPDVASGNTAAGVYKMKVQWGWIVTGGSGCPSSNGPIGSLRTNTQNADCTPPTAPLQDGLPAYYSTDPETFLSSPPCWFFPNALTLNMNKNGNFVYEIEGIDLMQRAAEHASARIFGQDIINDHFTDAAIQLGQYSCPAFSVCFSQLDQDGNPEPLQFWVEPNIGVARPPGAVQTTPDSDVATKGPLRVWACQERNPLGTLREWVISQRVKAATSTPGERGKGLTFNYDSTYENPAAPFDCIIGTQFVPNGCTQASHGRCMIWANEFPTGFLTDVNISSRIKALYVVNGGRNSPVLGFTPQIKWNFTWAVKAGGTMGTSVGTAYDAGNWLRPQYNKTACRGFRSLWPVPRQSDGQPAAAQTGIETVAAHRQANILGSAIAAELRVQGDPSDWLCSPVLGYGRCVSLVVINPFNLDRPVGQDCPSWTNINVGACNDFLTNRAWFIEGVDHQIKEGSYITVLKLRLLAPTSLVPGTPPLGQGTGPLGGIDAGGDVIGPNLDPFNPNPSSPPDPSAYA